jgi:hypothetical protein
VLSSRKQKVIRTHDIDAMFPPILMTFKHL